MKKSSIFTIIILFISIPQIAFSLWASFFDPATGKLTVVCDSDDEIKIWCSDGEVWINGVTPSDGKLNCADVKKLEIKCEGNYNNIINLEGVTPDKFTNMVEAPSAHYDSDKFPVVIDAGDGNNEVTGSGFGDYMMGGNGEDTQYGGDGNDRQIGGYGNDTQHGGAGNDLQEGGFGEDLQVGGDGSDFQWGGDGNDAQDGGNGNDNMWGGNGDDVQEGGDGYDELHGGAGDDEQNGGEGNDKYSQAPGSTDIIIDEAGIDTLDFSLATMAIFIDLDVLNTVQLVNAEDDSIKLEGIFENFIGSPFNDVIHVDPLNVPRSIDGGGSINGDTIYVDTMGSSPSDDGSPITISGYEPITYSNFTEVIFENELSTDVNPNLLEKFYLAQNYPNPFNPITTISYELPHRAFVQIDIIDLQGKIVNTLYNDYKEQGSHSIEWNGYDNKNSLVGAGIYFYRLKAGEFSTTKKMLLLR